MNANESLTTLLDILDLITKTKVVISFNMYYYILNILIYCKRFVNVSKNIEPDLKFLII